MNVAILFSGQLRGFKHVVNNLKLNLISKFSTVDTFFYLSENNYYDIDNFFQPTKIEFFKDLDYNTDGLVDIVNPKGFMGQWYSLYQCKNLMLSFNKKYDLIIRSRPDNNYINELDLKNINVNTINVCNWSNFGGINDRFAIGPTNLMLDYCDFYLDCKLFAGNSETKLKEYLDRKSIPLNLIDYYHYRINENGERREE